MARIRVRMDRAGYSRMLGRAILHDIILREAMMAGSCFAGLGTVPLPRTAKRKVTTKFTGGLNGKRAVARRKRQRAKRLGLTEINGRWGSLSRDRSWATLDEALASIGH
jgi:hypothetical protein